MTETIDTKPLGNDKGKSNGLYHNFVNIDKQDKIIGYDVFYFPLFHFNKVNFFMKGVKPITSNRHYDKEGRRSMGDRMELYGVPRKYHKEYHQTRCIHCGGFFYLDDRLGHGIFAFTGGGPMCCDCVQKHNDYQGDWEFGSVVKEYGKPAKMLWLGANKR